MADDYYNAQGAAASDRIQEYLIQQQQQRRQAMLDQLAIKKQQDQDTRENRRLDMENEQHQMDLALKRDQLVSSDAERKARAAEAATTGQDKHLAAQVKRVEGMAPGDIPDAEMVQAFDKSGIGGQYFPKPALSQQSVPGLVSPSSPLVPPSLRIAPGPAGTPSANEPPAQMGLTGTSDAQVRPYVGTRQDRERKQSETELDNYINTLPEGPIKQVAMAKRHGVTVTAGDLKLDNGGPLPGRLIKFDPVRGTAIDTATGQPITDSRPGDRVERLAEPKDTSARDTAAALAKDKFLESVRNRAQTSFDNLSKPYEETIRNVQKLNTVMDQNSNVADATIAEQVLKMTAGGAGSGLRLTQPLIDQILHSRSKWDDLSLALNRWDGQPGSLSLTPEQKVSIRALGKSILDQAKTMHDKISKARRLVNDPGANTETIHNAVTDLQDELDKGETPTPANGPPRIRYDMNGNRLP